MGVFTPICYPTALSRFYGEAPFYPRCSYNKTAVFSRPRHLAFDFPYMQVNRKDLRSWLVFDLDQTCDWIWESDSFPPPNLIVRDPNSGSSHWYYAIEPVRTGANARPAPMRYMRSVYKAMCSRIGADTDYAGGPVAKTPGHPQWETIELHSSVYSLGELADHPFFDDYHANQPPNWWTRQHKPGQDDDVQLASRHVSLFLSLQKIAFSSVWSFRCQGIKAFPSFYNHLLSQAHGLNRFRSMGFAKGNLTHSSLKATVKSVSRWVWDNYYASSRPNLGIMNLDPSLPLQERQRLSAARTHELRAKTTKQKIVGAVKSLTSKGACLSFSAIAREAGLCRQTVAKYRHTIKTALNDIDHTPETSSEAVCHASPQPPAQPVNFGLHQVTTRFVQLNDEEITSAGVMRATHINRELDYRSLPKCRSGP